MRSTQAIPFVYGVSIALSALGTKSDTITTNADAPFELHYFLAVANAEMLVGNALSTTKLYPGSISNMFSAMVTDQTTGRQLMSQKIPQAVLCGPRNRSLSEKRAVIFPPSTIFTVELTDLSNIAGGITVEFCLKGYKLFQS